MKVEVGVKESSKKKLARSTWAGHVERIGNKKWQSADVQKFKWSQGRLKLRRGMR